VLACDEVEMKLQDFRYGHLPRQNMPLKMAFLEVRGEDWKRYAASFFMGVMRMAVYLFQECPHLGYAPTT
jgi:hypothetical protein